MDVRYFNWDVNKIFKYDYDDVYQEHCGDGADYKDCELLVDFGPFKKGQICHVYIDSCTHGDFTMHVQCEGRDALFVPVWTEAKHGTTE